MIKVHLEHGHQVKLLKQAFEAQGWLRHRNKVVKTPDGFDVFTTVDDKQIVSDELERIGIDALVSVYEEQEEAPSLESAILAALHEAGITAPDIVCHIPKKWSLYPPMVLFKSNTFDHPVWDQLGPHKPQVLRKVAEYLGATHLAVNQPIEVTDVMRRPVNLVPIYGDFGPVPTSDRLDNPTDADFDSAFWCLAVQNGIFQTWAPRYTMFSRGNIKEKARVLGFDRIRGRDVVDLYAGIGYFTFSYLKAHARRVFCWEINPWSVHGLLKGAATNGFRAKLIHHHQPYTSAQFAADQPHFQMFVFQESNEFAPSRFASMEHSPAIGHINLGLLPTSKPAYPVARLLSRISTTPQTVVHVHENVSVNDFAKVSAQVSQAFANPVVHLEKVKTFAPDVWHVVMDVAIANRPADNP